MTDPRECDHPGCDRVLPFNHSECYEHREDDDDPNGGHGVLLADGGEVQDAQDESDDEHPWVEDAQDLRETDSPVLSDCIPPETRTEEVLTTLWQKGILRAKWDPEAGETAWQLSEMATTMYGEAGPESVSDYIRATEPAGNLPPGVRTHEVR